MSRQQIIDAFLNKRISKKLMAFLIATIGLFTGHVSDDNWIIIATVYISVEGAFNIVKELKARN